MSLKSKTFKFHPKMLIPGPYIECPKCQEKSFGLSMFMGGSYSRICYKCRYRKNYKLPSIKKKIIYLDQFVISNFAKSLDSKHPAHQRVIKDSYWIKLYKKIDTLLRYQLIICPDSFYHREESIVDQEFEKIQKIYEHLSTGATFYDKDTIIRFQTNIHLKNYLQGKPKEPPILKPEQIIHGNIHKWTDKINIQVHFPITKLEVHDTRKTRDLRYEEFKKVFKRWRSEKSISFSDRVLQESRSYGTVIWQVFFQYQQKLQEITEGKREVTIYDLPPSTNTLLHDMLKLVKEYGFTGEEKLKKIQEYFFSPHLLQVPYHKISSFLFAAIARKAAAGQVSPPSRGIFCDIEVIASLLPYCDAMFIDNENNAYLNEMPLKTEINYNTKTFSTNTRKKFLKYLDEILKNADPEHIKLVEKAYGKS